MSHLLRRSWVRLLAAGLIMAVGASALVITTPVDTGVQATGRTPSYPVARQSAGSVSVQVGVATDGSVPAQPERPGAVGQQPTGDLPRTGASLEAPLFAALVCVLAGGVLLMVSTVRRPRHRPRR